MNFGDWVGSYRKVFLTGVNVLSVFVGVILVRLIIIQDAGISANIDISQCGLGLYTSGKTIHDDPSSASFSCANNAD